MQIPKPCDEQDFERGVRVLFQCILKDPGVKLHGRRGQKQYGVDILGLRDRDRDKIVGVQCKLKGESKKLKAGEVREEVKKACLFRPPLSEYIIVTTAPTDAELDRLALELSIPKNKSHPMGMRVSVWGWETMQEEIRRHPEAIKAFDPSYTPWSDQLNSKLDAISLDLRSSPHIFEPIIGDPATPATLEYQINEYAALVSTRPPAALQLLERLLEFHGSTAPDHIRFRIISNIAGCHLNIGNPETAAQGFIDAFDLDPSNTKAVANKALGLLLNEDWRNLRSFAETHLLAHSDNARLAAFYIYSLIADEAINDPLDHVPDAVRSSPEVAIAKVRWLMERGGDGDWWEAAKAARKVHPQNDELSELYACALLEQVLNQSVFVHGRELGEVDHANVQTAIGMYEPLWSKICEDSQHVRNEQVSIPINLMIAYRLQYQTEKSIKTGEEALIRFPQNEELKVYLAAALIEQGETNRALDLISGLDSNHEIATMRLEIALANRDWRTIFDLISNQLDSFSEEKRTFPAAIGVLAEVELALAKDRRSILEAHQSEFQGDACALIVLAQCSRMHGIDDLAKSYFTAALSALDSGDDGISSRVSVAQEAMVRSLHKTAADTLHGYVPFDRVSPALLLLARALICDYPIRERTVEFFGQLTPQIRCLHDFLQLEGILHLNRGIPQDAVGPLTGAFEKKASVENLIYLVKAHIALGEYEAVRSLLLRSNIDTLPGSSLDRLDLCVFLIDFGDLKRTYDIAYESLINSIESGDVVAKYLHLVLRLLKRSRDPIDYVVACGFWVRFSSHRGGTYEVLVGEAADRLWGAQADPSNPFIANALGKKIGDSFEYTNAIGLTESWTISEIKPRWLQAFHYLSGVLGQKYPEVRKFAIAPIAAGDIQSVLDQVRHSSEAMYARAIPYLTGKAPMALVAKDLIGGSIAFADYLLSIGESVRVNCWTESEQSEARSWIDSNGRSGAVIDAFTAWRAAELRVFPILKERLGPLAIPASEMANIRAMVQCERDGHPQESMSVSYHNGQYFRHLITPDEHSTRLDSIRYLITDIEEACRIEAVVIPNELPDSAEQILRTPARDTFVCAILAREDRLLLCEDMIMRRWTRAVLDTKGVWLQAVLFSALESRTLTRNTYSDALVQLALRRHFHIPVSVPDLRSVFERDKSPNLTELETLCTVFGSKTADPVSHIEIAVDFINSIWADDRHRGERLTKPTSIVLSALLLNKNNERDLWAAQVYAKLSNAPQYYFAEWCKKHPN